MSSSPALPSPLHEQDTQLWSDLHRGVLTSARIAAALGFYEEQASKLLGLSRNFVSHQRALDCFHHLSQPPFLSQLQRPHSAAQASEESAGEREERIQVEQVNHMQVNAPSFLHTSPCIDVNKNRWR